MIARLNDRQWQKAMELYASATGKTMRDGLNKTSKDIAFKSIGYTKRRKNVWPVRQQDSPRSMSKFKAKGTGKGGKSILKVIGPQLQKKGNMVKWNGKNLDKDSLYFALATKKGARAWSGNLTKEAQRIFTKRMTAKGYVAASWTEAIVDLGGNPAEELMKFHNRGQGRHGGASKATLANKRVSIKNTAAGSKYAGFLAMEKAAKFVYRDRMKYIKSEMAKNGKKISGRKK